MIIKCEQCQTKFRLDDSKVTDKGVKVRCAKCKHVFSVRKEQPEPEKAGVTTSPEPIPTPVPTPDSFKPAETVFNQPSPSFASDNDLPEESGGKTEFEDKSQFEFATQDSGSAALQQDDFGISDFSADRGVEADESTIYAQENISFDEFDFGDSGSEVDAVAGSVPLAADFADNIVIQPPAAPVGVGMDSSQGLDFSGDDMFGAVVPQIADEPADPISFDFGPDSFADSMDLGGYDQGQKSSSQSLDSIGESPFNLGEIDFGDELTSVAVQQVNPEELKTSQEILFAPLAEAQEKTVDVDKFVIDEASTDHQDELPPLSIASRRKQGSFFKWLIASAAVLVVGVLGYLGLSLFSPDAGVVAKDSGKITVRAVKASYIENASIGTLLVISGEALNEYTVPRAGLQVKGAILDATGQVLASKSAYGGNSLTEEQLASMPLDKIEAAMANQFGDSLTNLEVAPGKAVRFTIVIPKPPKEGKDLSVEPAGSTVAARK